MRPNGPVWLRKAAVRTFQDNERRVLQNDPVDGGGGWGSVPEVDHIPSDLALLTKSEGSKKSISKVSSPSNDLF